MINDLKLALGVLVRVLLLPVWGLGRLARAVRDEADLVILFGFLWLFGTGLWFLLVLAAVGRIP